MSDSGREFGANKDEEILRVNLRKAQAEIARLREELESMTLERKDILDTAKACLVAAGGSEDEGELLWQLNNAGRKPSDFVRAQMAKLRQENERLQEGFSMANEEICQTLGKALGYPWYKDDPENFPAATEENGVCTGDHVAESIAMEAARTIGELRQENERLRKDVERLDSRRISLGKCLYVDVDLRAAIDAAKESKQ